MEEKRITKKQLNKIYRKLILKNILITIKYLYKIHSSEDKPELIVINGCDDTSLIKTIIWHILKYVFIALELLSIRKKIFHMLHGSYEKKFNASVFRKLAYNKSNWWLDCNYHKITLFENFCEELFDDSIICEAICELTSCKPEDYHLKNKMAREDMDEFKDTCFDCYAKTVLRSLDEEVEMGNVSATMYAKSFSDTYFLENDTKEENNDE